MEIRNGEGEKVITDQWGWCLVASKSTSGEDGELLELRVRFHFICVKRE